MVKIYREVLKTGRLVEISYDENQIHDICYLCGQFLPSKDRQKYYEQHGNYCPTDDKFHAGYIKGFKAGSTALEESELEKDN